MTYKKIIIIFIIIFIIVSPIFAKTKSGDYIPKLEFIIQPQNGENFTIDKYKSLEVGKEYQLQIHLSYKPSPNKPASGKVIHTIDASIRFDNPIIDIVDNPYNPIINEKNESIEYKFSGPVLDYSSESDLYDDVILKITFIPRETGKQYIYYSFDKKYIGDVYNNKRDYLKIEK